MEMIWSQSRILHLLQCFSTIIKARIGFFDVEGKEMLAHPSTQTGYCALIRSTDRGLGLCMKCDHNAYTHASKRREPYIYRCHAGLTEMIAPIVASGEHLIGYLMIGQVRPGEPGGGWQDARRLVDALPLDPVMLEAAYRELPAMDTEQVRSCAHILQACAAYVWLDDYIHILNEPLSKRVETYIRANLNQPLSLGILMGEFGVGKTALCKAVKVDFGVTIGELIRGTRIREAKRLLQSSELPVSGIAGMVGIDDYNYFTKVFKEETGVPPSVFRRLCRADHLYVAQ